MFQKHKKFFYRSYCWPWWAFEAERPYVNLSRTSELNEKTYRRWFGKRLDFIEFNQLGISEVIPASAELIAVMDASFVAKSGDKTHGLGKFYNAKASKQGSLSNRIFVSRCQTVYWTLWLPGPFRICFAQPFQRLFHRTQSDQVAWPTTRTHPKTHLCLSLENQIFQSVTHWSHTLNSAIDLSLIKSSPFYQQLCNFGVVFC